MFRFDSGIRRNPARRKLNIRMKYRPVSARKRNRVPAGGMTAFPVQIHVEQFRSAQNSVRGQTGSVEHEYQRPAETGVQHRRKGVRAVVGRFAERNPALPRQLFGETARRVIRMQIADDLLRFGTESGDGRADGIAPRAVGPDVVQFSEMTGNKESVVI